jgi:hypothetical protein
MYVKRTNFSSHIRRDEGNVHISDRIGPAPPENRNAPQMTLTELIDTTGQRLNRRRFFDILRGPRLALQLLYVENDPAQSERMQPEAIRDYVHGEGGAKSPSVGQLRAASMDALAGRVAETIHDPVANSVVQDYSQCCLPGPQGRIAPSIPVCPGFGTVDHSPRHISRQRLRPAFQRMKGFIGVARPPA